MRSYLPAMLFIGILICGQQDTLWAVPVALVLVWGFYKTMIKLETEEEI